jgi:hypothetical protein
MNMDKTEIGFDKTNTFPIMVKHHIVPAADGQLEHWMDDKLRATVPPESWDAYCKEWPVCREVCDSMLLPRTEKPEAILQSTVDAMLRASQDLPDDSGIILAVAEETQTPPETAVQNTENPDHPE